MTTSTLIQDFLNHLSRQKSCSPLTIKAYFNDLNQAFSDQNSILLETTLLSSARTAQSNWGSLGLASRNRKTATLKSFFKWLFETNQISKPLSEQLICPKVPKKIPDFISVDEVISIMGTFKTIEKSPSNLRSRVLFLLLYGGGLRISEACHLRWNAINFNTRSILVRGKGQKERIVIIPLQCLESLKILKSDSEFQDYIFTDGPLNPRTGYEMIRIIGQKTGLLKPLHPHSLRHSYATHLLASGANLRTLQTLLGHESLTATEKYTHLNVDQLARTLEESHPLSKKNSNRK